MKKILALLFTTLFIFSMMPISADAQLADGTYTIKYQVNAPGENNVSIANDYFLKPAKLIVANGTQKVQLTMKNSTWITEFAGPHGGNRVVSKDQAANQRTVEFTITSIDQPTVITMKVDIDDMNYHHTYSTDFVWATSSLTLVEAAKKEEQTTTNQQNVTNSSSTSEKNSSSAKANQANATTSKEAKAPSKTEEAANKDEQATQQVAIQEVTPDIVEATEEISIEAEVTEEPTAEISEEPSTEVTLEQSSVQVAQTNQSTSNHTVLYSVLILVAIAGIGGLLVLLKKRKHA
jgi:heme-binding NEAT domain protein